MRIENFNICLVGENVNVYIKNRLDVLPTRHPHE